MMVLKGLKSIWYCDPAHGTLVFHGSIFSEAVILNIETYCCKPSHTAYTMQS